MEYLKLYQQYLVELPNESGITRCKCPLHDDKNPSAGVYLDTGVFSCFNCGTFSAEQFAKKVNFDLSTLQIDGSVLSTKKLKINPEFDKLREKAIQNMELNDLVANYCKTKNIQYETLVKYGVGYLNPLDSPTGKEAIAMFSMINNHVYSIVLRLADGSKTRVSNSFLIPSGLEYIPKDYSGDVILVEGDTDRLRLCELTDLPVIAMPTAMFSKYWVRFFKGINKKIVIPQTDSAGSKMVNDILKHFPDSTVTIELPWERDQLGEDVAEWCSLNNTNTLVSLINSSKSDALTTVYEYFNPNSSFDENEDEVISRCISFGDTVIVAGPMKSSKTWMVITLIKSLLTPAHSFIGHPELVSTGKFTDKIYLVEEEGSKHALHARLKNVLGNVAIGKVLLSHRKSMKIDTVEGIQTIAKIIRENGVGCLILDPFQEVHSRDEDSSKDTKIIWDNIKYLKTLFPKLIVVIVHHFTKAGDISKGWLSMRGSSRMPAVADVGIFMQAEKDVIKVRIEGRSIETVEDPVSDQTTITVLRTESGELTCRGVAKLEIRKIIDFINFIKTNGDIKFVDACKKFDVHANTVRNWIRKSDGKLKTTSPSKNNPVTIYYDEEVGDE